MTDPDAAVKIAGIGAVLSFATALLSALVTLITLKMKAAVKETKVAMTELRHNTNAIKDQLVAVTASASKAEGNLEGRAQLKEDLSNSPEEHSG